MMRKLLSAITLTITTLMVVSNAGAANALIIFNDQADWEDAVSGFTITTEDFDSADSQLLRNGTIALSTGVVVEGQAPNSFAAGSITSGFEAFSGGQILQGDFDPGDAFIISFPEPTIGFGFDYLDVDLGGVKVTGLFDGDNTTDTVDVPFGVDASAPVADFFGILADTPVSEFTLSLTGDDSETWDLDNLSFAVAEEPAAAVFEPSAVVALGLLGLGCLRYKRVLVRKV